MPGQRESRALKITFRWLVVLVALALAAVLVCLLLLWYALASLSAGQKERVRSSGEYQRVIAAKAFTAIREYSADGTLTRGEVNRVLSRWYVERKPGQLLITSLFKASAPEYDHCVRFTLVLPLGPDAKVTRQNLPPSSDPCRKAVRRHVSENDANTSLIATHVTSGSSLVNNLYAADQHPTPTHHALPPSETARYGAPLRPH